MSRFTAADWPTDGDVVGGFCRGCGSWFCPHAMPDLYRERKLTFRPGQFDGAANTLVLDGDHARGIARGAAGQAFAAEQLGVPIITEARSPFDLRAADGTRVDVKTSRRGMPLMVPKEHAYKLDPGRIDALALVWDGDGHELVGQVSVADFRARCRDDLPLPVPTFCVAVADLDPIPDLWRA